MTAVYDFLYVHTYFTFQNVNADFMFLYKVNSYYTVIV